MNPSALASTALVTTVGAALVARQLAPDAPTRTESSSIELGDLLDVSEHPTPERYV